MNKTTLYLPHELQEQLKDAARRSGRSQADLIREALGHYLEHQPPPAPRSIAIGEDEELAARDSEAWLDAQWGRA